MSKGITIHCTVCRSTRHQHIPSQYGKSGHTTEQVYVAGCDKCSGKPKYKETVSHSSGGGYSGGSGGDGGCLGPLAMLALFVFFMVCCCGGLGGKT